MSRTKQQIAADIELMITEKRVLLDNAQKVRPETPQLQAIADSLAEATKADIEWLRCIADDVEAL